MSYFVHVQLNFIGHRGASAEDYALLHAELAAIGAHRTIVGEHVDRPGYGQQHQLPHGMYRVFSDLTGSQLENAVATIAKSIWPDASVIVCDWDHCWFHLKPTTTDHSASLLAAVSPLRVGAGSRALLGN